MEPPTKTRELSGLTATADACSQLRSVTLWPYDLAQNSAPVPASYATVAKSEDPAPSSPDPTTKTVVPSGLVATALPASTPPPWSKRASQRRDPGSVLLGAAAVLSARRSIGPISTRDSARRRMTH